MPVQRGRDIGVDIAAEVAALSAGVDWETELASVRDDSLAYPAVLHAALPCLPAGQPVLGRSAGGAENKEMPRSKRPSLLHPLTMLHSQLTCTSLYDAPCQGRGLRGQLVSPYHAVRPQAGPWTLV